MSYEYRRSEWYMALAMLLWGFTLLWPGSTFSNGNFLVFAQYGPEAAWGIFASLIGASRCMALWVNGHWQHTPNVRLLMSCFSAGVWSMTLFVLLVGWENSDFLAPSTGIPIYTVLLIMEIEGAFNAGRDRHRRRDDE